MFWFDVISINMLFIILISYTRLHTETQAPHPGDTLKLSWVSYCAERRLQNRLFKLIIKRNAAMLIGSRMIQLMGFGLCSLSWREEGSDPKCSYLRLSRQLFEPMIILTCGQALTNCLNISWRIFRPIYNIHTWTYDHSVILMSIIMMYATFLAECL